jgi:uncharacterized RDD family membrane protein YckC
MNESDTNDSSTATPYIKPASPEQNKIDSENQNVQNITPAPLEQGSQNENINPIQTQQTSVEEKPGGLGLRFSASVFDSMILGIPLNILFFLYFLITVESIFAQSNTINLIYIILYVVSLLSYYAYFNVKKGATPGKKIYGMKIVDVSTKNYLTYKNAIVRELANRIATIIPFIGFLYGVINFFVILSSPQRRGIHDKLSKSQVLVVNKSWSFVKQAGLFILLVALNLAPFILIIPKYITSTQEINKCVLECTQLKSNQEMSTQELQTITNTCYQECSK